MHHSLSCNSLRGSTPALDCSWKQVWYCWDEIRWNFNESCGKTLQQQNLSQKQQYRDRQHKRLERKIANTIRTVQWIKVKWYSALSECFKGPTVWAFVYLTLACSALWVHVCSLCKKLRDCSVCSSFFQKLGFAQLSWRMCEEQLKALEKPSKWISS